MQSINRNRMRISRLLCIVLALFIQTRAKRHCVAGGPPNIVLIMADDLGYAELGCYGQKKIETPNIDQLASEGVRFTQFYAGAPTCAPARCTLMTGLHAGHAYVRNNHSIGRPGSFLGQTPLLAGTPTIATMLKQTGYATGAFGTWGLGGIGSTGNPLKHGFDRFFGYDCQAHAHNLYPKYLVDNEKHRTLKGNNRSLTGEHYAPQVIADEALEFVRQHHQQPFFLYYPTVVPHLALQSPEEEVAHYRGRWPETPYEAGPDAPYPYLPHPTPRACYAAMISFHDKQVGRIMALLKELEIDDNTIILYTSDNGTTHVRDQVDYEFFESVGPLRGLKGSLYEGGIRVPMIARWTGHTPKGTVSDHLSAHYDLKATVADLAGVADSPANNLAKSDSISMLPTILNQKDAQEEHEYLFWDYAGYGGQIAVRRGDWKGVKQNLLEDPNALLELYDLRQDPSEKYDIAEQHPKIAADLAQLMLDARTQPEIEAFRFGEYRPSSH